MCVWQEAASSGMQLPLTCEGEFNLYILGSIVYDVKLAALTYELNAIFTPTSLRSPILWLILSYARIHSSPQPLKLGPQRYAFQIHTRNFSGLLFNNTLLCYLNAPLCHFTMLVNSCHYPFNFLGWKVFNSFFKYPFHLAHIMVETCQQLSEGSHDIKTSRSNQVTCS